MKVTTTRVFKNGSSLAVRLPKDFQLPIGEVKITKRSNGIIEIEPQKKSWSKGFLEFFGNPENADDSWQRPKFSKKVKDLSW